jgi:hypothetical protein
MFDASTLEVFIASTNDLMDERLAVERVLRDWNSRYARKQQIMLKPVRWELDTTPDLRPGSFQAAINRDLLDPADILVAIVGTRLGSPTGTSVAGTVEEIERFAAAGKPVLLYFSDRPSNPSELDPDELQRVQEFRQAMQQRGLYSTFRDLAEFEKQLRDHLGTVLEDFQALLIPAARALARGYFTNFVLPTHTRLLDKSVSLPDYQLPQANADPAANPRIMTLRFDDFRIRIARPRALDDATDRSARQLRDNLLAEVNIATPAMRRAFRVYVPKMLKQQLDERRNAARETIELKRFDIVDFPTPLIALNEFVTDREQRLSKPASPDNPALGYWQRQKVVQFELFFVALREYLKAMDEVGFFAYENINDLKLPD